MLSLAQQLASQVRKLVRDRGYAYLLNGHVTPVRGDRRNLVAVVRGAENYTVSVGPGAVPGIIDAFCSCPYVRDRFEVCKHIWAAILYADEHDLLEVLNRGGLELMPGETPSELLAGNGREGIPGPRWGPRAWSPAPGSVRRGLAETADRLDPLLHQFAYLIDTPPEPRGVSVTVAVRERKVNGTWGRARSWPLEPGSPDRAADPGDREILALLLGPDPMGPTSAAGYLPRYGAGDSRQGGATYFLRRPTEAALLARMCRTQRCFLVASEVRESEPLRWDEGPEWEFVLRVEEADDDNLTVEGRLVRDGESVALNDPRLRLGGSVVFVGNTAGAARLPGESWMDLVQSPDRLIVHAGDRDRFLEEVLLMPGAPRLDLPPGLAVQTLCPEPAPILTIHEPQADDADAPLVAELRFRYGDRIVAHREPAPGIYDREARRITRRDPHAEQRAVAQLLDTGFRMPQERASDPAPFTLTHRQFGPAVRALIAESWVVEAEETRYRTPGEFHMEVTSGIDWFDLHGTLAFDDLGASLPELLRAAASGEHFVRLNDGSLGLLPEDWLNRYGLLGALGSDKHGDFLRFSRVHVGVLDALLEALPETRYDDRFAEARRRLFREGGIPPVSPSPSFRGRLRDYQKEGLGWMDFLGEAGLGGCLADDMGLGKTVQVLALLDLRRHRRGPDAPVLPSLVVVPRSVLGNWHSEAARFTPDLRVLVHAGPGRRAGFRDCDVVLTTYGTLLRDILRLQRIAFDCVVLDEAQTIKNAGTGRAKAARLLKARHRLALSGTPIENHLGELWSLFEFLNPGLLGTSRRFQKLVGAAGPGTGRLDLVARTVRPFILRRTKKQVAPELPDRTEQTILCDLKGKQLRRYRELRDHYRASLLETVERVGLNQSKFQVLEALLRLRQAACHPALIDPELREEAGAKIEVLLPQLRETVEEGNKALVFSQFTSFLALVREHLDREGLVYEYLDGRTRNREEKIARFQEDPDCPLFLISLKAGGLGLNLTAAEYVFLLDPWWNPAVEAQAIDRSHRIGQTRHVFAYRLIARDTVEERILALQDSKRDLAASIITEDRNLMRTLRIEDLNALLS